MDVDVAVLGGGPGGYTAAIRAAQLGAKVACIEKEPELGGTCLRVGCIPTKAWVQTAQFLHQAEETFGKLGVKVSEPQLDFATANEWKTSVVKQMTGGVAGLLKANGVEWIKGAGRFRDANTISVDGGEDIRFKQAIVDALVNVPVPFTHSTPFALSSPATPVVICLTTPAFHAFDTPKSSCGSPTFTPNFAKLSCASLRAKAVCTQAFVGMHPTRRHVPPSSGSFSMHATFAPSCAARIAAV